MRIPELKPEFVEYIPDVIEEGRLYISIPYTTAIHLCCCGCGHEVVTPLSPRDWRLTFDGEGVSLHPSIGNWSFSCRSHYWITNNKILSAIQWSKEQIDAGRERDAGARANYFEKRVTTTPKATHRTAQAAWLRRVWRRIVGRPE